MRIAIFGGAFDPPTNGHTELAKCLIQRLGFDEIWMMPVFHHTFEKKMASFDHRMNMCLIATESTPRIKVSFYEAEKNHQDGTLSLFRKLKKSFKHQFYMVIGMDNANLIDKWINPKELIKEVPFVVVMRKGTEPDEKINWYLQEPHIFVKTCDIIEMSSTIIRQAIKDNNEDILNKGLNLKVKKYIADHKLYL